MRFSCNSAYPILSSGIKFFLRSSDAEDIPKPRAYILWEFYSFCKNLFIYKSRQKKHSLGTLLNACSLFLYDFRDQSIHHERINMYFFVSIFVYFFFLCSAKAVEVEVRALLAPIPLLAPVLLVLLVLVPVILKLLLVL